MKRVIHNVEFDRGRAEDHANHLRLQGRRTSIYRRTIRAEGLAQVVWVVVTDAPQETPEDPQSF